MKHKAKPIMPDYLVGETYQDFLNGKDVYLETALALIETANRMREKAERVEELE